MRESERERVREGGKKRKSVRACNPKNTHIRNKNKQTKERIHTHTHTDVHHFTHTELHTLTHSTLHTHLSALWYLFVLTLRFWIPQKKQTVHTSLFLVFYSSCVFFGRKWLT